jgi:DNA primase
MTSGRTSAFEHWKKQARAIPIMDEIARRGVKLKQEGKEFIGPCPLCGGHDRFAVNTKKEVWNCRGCNVGGDVIGLVRHLDGVEFLEACTTLAGPPPNNGRDRTAAEAHKVLAAKYRPYTDENGTALFYVERYEYRYPDGSFVLKEDGRRKKSFKQKRPDPDHFGKWINNIDGVPIVPYRLPELIEAIANDHSIAIVEGEAKADLLWSWNVPATCNAMGAGKWKSEHSEFLRGADVCIIPDNDEPGRNHADVVGQSLQGIAKSVRVLELPGLAPKGDVIDWAKQGGTVEQLYDLSERESKPWAPHAKQQSEQQEQLEGDEDNKQDTDTKVGDELPQLFINEINLPATAKELARLIARSRDFVFNGTTPARIAIDGDCMPRAIEAAPESVCVHGHEVCRPMRLKREKGRPKKQG